MAKETENAPVEREMAGMKLSTWAKLINVGLGCAMVFFSVFSFFNVATDVLDASPVMIISFKVYEM